MNQKPNFYLAIFIILLMIGCQKPLLKIGVLFPHQLNDRTKKEKIYISERIKELGGEALFASAKYDDHLQISQAREMLDQGVKVLIVNPVNYNTEAEIVRLAHKKSVKVIAYDRIIKNCDLDYFISFNNEKVGNLMTDYVTKLKPDGTYMILGGDKSDQNAVWIYEAELKNLTSFIQSGKIKIVYSSFIESWSADDAKNEVEKYINLSNGTFPDVIVAASDGISNGVIDALKEFGLEGKVLVTGQDASLRACRNIVKGYQSMSVYKPFKRLAYKAAELAINIAKGVTIKEQTTDIANGYKNVTSILFEPISIDKTNMKSTVIADGFQSESEIFHE